MPKVNKYLNAIKIGKVLTDLNTTEESRVLIKIILFNINPIFIIKIANLSKKIWLLVTIMLFI